MKKSRVKFLGLATAALLGTACSTENGTTPVGDVGGSSTAGHGTGGGSASDTGGSSASSGGASAGGTATGGGSSTTGGTATGGGSSTTGGTATTGGSSPGTGGNATGGSSPGTGGNATGGGTTVTGGTATGGGSALTGGSATTGGAANTGGTATGGTATGGSATGGSSACAAATITQVSAADYQIKVCNLTMDVNPQIGARITTMSLGGTNVIKGSSTSSSTTDWGSTFWTSPQSAWDGNTSTTGDWPPPTQIDSDPYTPTVNGTHLVTTGKANANLGASVTKDFSADATTGWMTILYTILATKAIQAAPWEITRVPRGGLVFFPCPTGNTLNKGPLTTMTQSSGMAWFDDSLQSIPASSGPKAIADGSGGWMAYARNGLLFVKKFPDQPSSAFAPGEGDVEVYPGSDYLELEVQGPYTSIASGSSLGWTTKWKVVTIPSGVALTPDSAALITLAQQTAAS
jgi:hypothetical protein